MFFKSCLSNFAYIKQLTFFEVEPVGHICARQRNTANKKQ